MWLGAAEQTVTFVSGHRYRFVFTSATPFGDPSTAAQIVSSWTDVVWPIGYSLTPGFQASEPNEKTGEFDYAGPGGQVVLPAMPPGVTLTVSDVGLTSAPPSPNAGPLVFVGLTVAGVVLALAVYAAKER